MTSFSPEPPSGRRDNGLSSREWGALVDVDPRLSDTLLGSLGAIGVAAYVEPAHGVDTVSRAVAHPQRPLDRLWVDPAQADEARAVVGAEIADLASLLAAEDPTSSVSGFIQPVPRTAATRVLSPPVLPALPGTPPIPPGPAAPAAPPTSAEVGPSAVPGPTAPADGGDEDAEAWRLIVAGWTQDAPDTPVPRWPVTEDLDGAAPTEPEPASRWRREARPPAADDDDDEPLPAWLEPEALDDDGHYVPPPPPPIPRVHRHTVGAVACLALGLVLVFAPNLVGQVSSTGLGLVGILLMLGGAGALVWHMRDAPPTDSGPDDGAVV